jgi:hypothetical protein
MSSIRGRRGALPTVPGIALLAVLLCSVTVAGEIVSEYQLKAEFMERFTRFIEWPAGSPVNDEQTPFSICVAGDDPFGPHLRNLAASRKIKAKSVLIRQVTVDAQLEGCHMLFIGASEKPRLGALVKRAEQRTILTVGDTAGLGQAGVMINFYSADDKVRFEINPDAAAKSGLHISSKLLKLARVVGEE